MSQKKSRVAVVTGGSSGIGLSVCEALREEGFRLGILDLDIGSGSDSASDDMALRVDVADPTSVDSAFGTLLDHFGQIDVLVNNAGITGSTAATKLHETPIEDWDRVIAVNVRGPYLCTRAVLPSMIERGEGHIITIASVAAIVPFPGRSAYSTSKGAALLLSKSVALDYASAGIRSNAVCPGMVETPMTQWRLDQPELRAEIESRIPLGRVAVPAEIAEAVVLLASERLSYMTGHALVLDGGWTVQ